MDQARSYEESNISRLIARAHGGEPLFVGDALVGFVIAKRDGFDAVTVDGNLLGRFNTADAAGRALFTGHSHDQ